MSKNSQYMLSNHVPQIQERNLLYTLGNGLNKKDVLEGNLTESFKIKDCIFVYNYTQFESFTVRISLHLTCETPNT